MNTDERKHPFRLFSNFDELMQVLEEQFNEALSNSSTFGPCAGGSCKSLPAVRGFVGSMMPPALRGAITGMSIDVREHDDEVIVAADIPGAEKDDITISIIDPQTLEIACRRGVERNEGTEEEGYFVQERMYGSMSRMVRLPAPVLDDGSAATFKNGVLEIRLKKSAVESKKKIQIE